MGNKTHQEWYPWPKGMYSGAVLVNWYFALCPSTARKRANRNTSNVSAFSRSALSWCIGYINTLTSVPLGIRVPSWSVMSFLALRVIPTSTPGPWLCRIGRSQVSVLCEEPR